MRSVLYQRKVGVTLQNKERELLELKHSSISFIVNGGHNNTKLIVLVRIEIALLHMRDSNTEKPVLWQIVSRLLPFTPTIH